MSTHTPNAPVDTHFDGPTFAKVWRNFTQDQQPFYNTTVGRIYTDKDGETQETRNLGDSDLLKLPELAARARETIRQFKAQDREQDKARQQPSQSERQQFRQSRKPQQSGQGQYHDQGPEGPVR